MTSKLSPNSLKAPYLEIRGVRMSMIALSIIWLACFVLAVTSDADAKHIEPLKGFVTAMGYLIDPMSRLGSRSTFPELTRLYYSIAYLSALLWSYLIWVWLVSKIGSAKSGLLCRHPLRFLDKVFLLVLVPVWSAVIFSALALNHGGDVRLAALGSSTIHLGLFGMVFVLIVGAMCSIVGLTIARVFGFVK